MKLDIVRESRIVETPRVVQVGGMFDLSWGERSRHELRAELPLEERSWQVGLIVGPSGCGKSTLAREAFGDAVVNGFKWPEDQSILDGFPDAMSITEITGLLNAVGFGSVPNWLRPFHVLSNGEQFRATVARGLAERPDLLVIDEFTSVVDRQVAKVAAHCVAKAIRRHAGRKFVGVSCHYDIVDWLQPDWVFEPHVGAFEWRLVQRRPAITVEIRSVHRDVWNMFSPHHYLSADFHVGAFCIGGFVEGQCVAFTSAMRFPHPRARDIYQGHRTVVLPDFQGLGLASVLTEWMGAHLWERGWRLHVTTAHPALIASRARSPRWRLLNHGHSAESARSSAMRKHRARARARLVASFAYSGSAPRPSHPVLEGPLLGKKARFGPS